MKSIKERKYENTGQLLLFSRISGILQDEVL